MLLWRECPSNAISSRAHDKFDRSRAYSMFYSAFQLHRSGTENNDTLNIFVNEIRLIYLEIFVFWFVQEIKFFASKHSILCHIKYNCA